MVPLAWSGNKPGHEIEHPMAIVILCGLVASTQLNLGLMPAFYQAFGRTWGGRPEDERATPWAGSKANGRNTTPRRRWPPCRCTPIRAPDRGSVRSGPPAMTLVDGPQISAPVYCLAIDEYAKHTWSGWLWTFSVWADHDRAMGAGGTGVNVQMPRIGQELGRGAEGVVYENLDQPGTVVKEFHKGGGSPVQARNEFQNLENARAIHPDNVVKAQPPTDPRQGFLVKERVLPTDAPEDLAQKVQVLQDFLPKLPDAGGNLMWGTTVNNPTPRWLLVE